MKLIATNISNLTDARFFAAYLPELLVLPTISPETWPRTLEWLQEVQAWVVGPRWGVRLEGIPGDSFLSSLQHAGIDTLVHVNDHGKIVPIPEFSNIVLATAQDYTTSMTNLDLIDALIVTNLWDLPELNLDGLDYAVYGMVHNFREWQELVLRHPQIAGITLEGGDEEKVGVKSYDAMTEILEEVFN